MRDFPRETKDRLALLDNVRVVISGVKFPGNIGMVARAMKNTGLSDLRLAAPRAELTREAYKRAVSGADIVDRAMIHQDIYKAVSDCGLVIGATRRRRVVRQNVLSPEECAHMLRPALVSNKAALVFGPEDTGLTNDQLALCHWVVAIHTGTDYESFNISHSAALLFYLVNRAVVGYEPMARKLAAAKDQENMFADIRRFLLEIGFIHEDDPKRMMLIIRRMLHRAALSGKEIKIIRGILRQARWRIENPKAPLEPGDK